MKIIYLRSAEINKAWSQRSLRGFYKCKDEIREMFQKGIPYKYTTFWTLWIPTMRIHW